MSRRAMRPLSALSVVMAIGLCFGPPALAGEYTVAQCHGANSSHEASTLGSFRGDYAMRNECSSQPDRALKVIPNSGAQTGRRGYWYWEAPPGTKIVAVKAEARLRRADGHKARLYTADSDGHLSSLVASGLNEPAGFEPVKWSAPAGSAGASRFYAALVCEDATSTCPAPSEAKTYIREVELTLRDTVRPTVELSEDVIEPGWKRGQIILGHDVFDVGSGVETLQPYVNASPVGGGQAFTCGRIAGTNLVRLRVPCSHQPVVGATELTTSARPFRDGRNTVATCADDYSVTQPPNTGCAATEIRVDNTVPGIAFRNEQQPADPELIVADVSDATSGIDEQSGSLEYRQVGTEAWSSLSTEVLDGILQARVDSELDPPGAYEFRARARDVAGNQGITDTREDGSKMELQFPLKEPATLDAFMPGGQTRQLAGYRESSKVRGYLRRPDGTPIVGEQVVIQEKFDEGSLVQRRTELAKTGADGGFVSSIPAGPSRQITVAYDGSRRYRAKIAPKLDFNVRSRVSLSVEHRVKAGRAAHFRGKVGRYFARVPTGGKLVELQFKKRAKTWNTAKEALGTTSRGRIQIPYRFRRYYTEPVTFVFRLKVTREGDWPYRLPASSKPVQVTVVPSRK